MRTHRFISSLIAAACLLSACNFTLAQDVTPPPGYVPPTPAATLGPLHPPQAPGTENGARIFVEKCAPCHGATGLGDGEQGIQLGVTVPAFGLPEIARPASPAQWYTVVTQGNIERFMPPFASLSDQERWDVVAYALTLHTSPEEITKGQRLFESACPGCSTEFFRDQQVMSALSGVALARIVRQGNEQVPAFGEALSDEDVWAVAAYLRTLSFDTGPMAAATAPATAGPETATPGPATAAGNGEGTVRGSIENRTGKDLPAGLVVTLRGYDHGADPSAGPQEVFSRQGEVDEEGSFIFEDVETPLNRIFLAEVTHDGIELQSGFAIVGEGDTRLTLPPITLYKRTDDYSALVVQESRIFFEYGTDVVQVFNVYTFRNPGDEIIVVRLSESGEIPFLKAPRNSSGFGYEPMQDTEPFQSIDNGFAIPPGEGVYGIIAFASVPEARDYEFSQEYILPAERVTVFVPEGIALQSERATDLGVQAMEDFRFRVYELGSLDAGETLQFGISGGPADPASPASTRQNVLFGAAALGLTLLAAGAWMYLRDRGRGAQAAGEDEEGDERKAADDIIDAIIALDDLHRAGKISQAAYRARRAELKQLLKDLV